MRKFLSVVIAVCICFCCPTARAESTVQVPIIMCCSDEVYAVDYVFQVNGNAGIQAVRCTFDGGLLEWNYIESEARLYISLASAYAFPKTESIISVTGDAGAALVVESVHINGILRKDVASVHTESEISAVPPTCDNEGWTSGKKCSVCGYIMAPPQSVPALGPNVEFSWTADGFMSVSGQLSDNAAAQGRIVIEFLSADRKILQTKDITNLDQSNFSVSVEGCIGAAFARIIRIDTVTGETVKEFLYTPIKTGYTVGGKIKSFGDSQDVIRVELLQNGQMVQEISVSGSDASYEFVGVPAGTYTLRVSKQRHVTREYTLIVGNP